MSGELPDVHTVVQVDDASQPNASAQGGHMPLIQVKALEEVFTQPQKQEIIERLTDTLGETEGENTRQVTAYPLEEVASGDRGIGGQTPTVDDAKALVCGSSAAAAESSLVVADGTQISLRQVGAGDRAALAGLFARLTPESRHRRFLSPKRELTAGELTFFTDIDHLNHEAIAAVDQRDDSIVGVARYVRGADRAHVAEVAIEVADAFQRMGIGTALARLTIQRARANGLTFLTARTLWENRAARGLLRQHGFRARQSHGGEIDYELKLEELGLATVKAAPDLGAVSHAHAVGALGCIA
jgi:4-oxalocrotonate tautomerase family enzyme